jgi:hypothetical protein
LVLEEAVSLRAIEVAGHKNDARMLLPRMHLLLLLLIFLLQSRFLDMRCCFYSISKNLKPPILLCHVCNLPNSERERERERERESMKVAEMPHLAFPS